MKHREPVLAVFASCSLVKSSLLVYTFTQFFHQLAFLHLAAATVLLLAWIICLTSPYFLVNISLLFFTAHPAVQPLDLSIFVTAQMLQKPSLSHEHVHVRCGNRH